jgi:hypothetical protein
MRKYLRQRNQPFTYSHRLHKKHLRCVICNDIRARGIKIQSSK